MVNYYKKRLVLKRSAIAAAVATVFLLTACASGGGGSGTGGSGNTSPDMPTTPNPNQGSTGPAGSGGAAGGGGGGSGYLRSQVPFGTPTLAGSFNPYSGTSSSWTVGQNYVVDGVSGNGGQDVIWAGRMTQPATAATWKNTNIQMFDWQGGNLVNDTAKWFPGGINTIVGADPNIQFVDFFKTGKLDMFVAPSTDGALASSGPAVLFKNNGSSFSRTNYSIGNVWGHGATVGSLKQDGWMDVAISDYGSNTTLMVNNRTNGFTAYQAVFDATGNKALQYGGASVAMADFTSAGKSQLIMTDNGCGGGIVACSSATNIHMYSWTIDPVSNQLTFDFLKNLPKSTLSHAYLALNKDFDASGKQSLIVFSRPSDNNAKQSAIQFMKNDGSGNFTDVTGSMLSGYNTSTAPSYKPQFIDLGNGQESMVVSGSDYSGSNNSTQILVKQSASGPYTAAFQNLISDFATQANQIANASTNTGNQVNIVKDNSGNVFLVSTLRTTDGAGNTQQQVYLSPLGKQVTGATATAAFNQLKAAWPYMTDVSANTLLAKTSATYMTDAGPALLLNYDAITNPYGGIQLATRGGMVAANGFISGVKLDNGNTVATDSFGRTFPINLQQTNYQGPNSFGMNSEHIDQFNLTSHSEYLINGSVNTYETPLGNLRLGYEDRTRYNTVSGDPSQGAMINNLVPKQYSVGMPSYYRKGAFSTGLQYTSLNQSPWFAFSGAYGQVTNASTLEHTFSYQKNGFSAAGAVTYTTHTFTPGLITNISPIAGAWAETGYRYSDYGQIGDMGVYLGVKPVVLSGNLTANLPTSADNQGNPVYTQTKMQVMSSATPYVRALYTNAIDKNTQYRISGMSTTTGLWRMMAELRYTFD